MNRAELCAWCKSWYRRPTDRFCSHECRDKRKAYDKKWYAENETTEYRRARREAYLATGKNRCHTCDTPIGPYEKQCRRCVQRNGRPALDEALVRQIIDLREQGMTQKAIAKHVGVSQPTVGRYCKMVFN